VASFDLVFDDGQIREQGTHKQLLELGDRYTEFSLIFKLKAIDCENRLRQSGLVCLRNGFTRTRI